MQDQLSPALGIGKSLHLFIQFEQEDNGCATAIPLVMTFSSTDQTPDQLHIQCIEDTRRPLSIAKPSLGLTKEIAAYGTQNTSLDTIRRIGNSQENPKGQASLINVINRSPLTQPGNKKIFEFGRKNISTRLILKKKTCQHLKIEFTPLTIFLGRNRPVCMKDLSSAPSIHSALTKEGSA